MAFIVRGIKETQIHSLGKLRSFLCYSRRYVVLPPDFQWLVVSDSEGHYLLKYSYSEKQLNE
jgi:hypothetical protein